MNVAILGATGCVGKELVRRLAESEHNVIASYRDIDKIESVHGVEWRPINMAKEDSVRSFMQGADVLVYLLHSLDSSKYENLDLALANRAGKAAKDEGIKKIVYQGGVFPKQDNVSTHLTSRRDTGTSLAAHGLPVAESRASVLVGKESVSYRMVYYLSKRVPVMLVPKWLNSKCSPLALTDAVEVLAALVDREVDGHEVFEVGSETLRYKDFLKMCGRTMHKREPIILDMPLPPTLFPMTLGAAFVKLTTGVDYHTSHALMGSLKNDSHVTNNRFSEVVGRNPLPLQDAIKMAGTLH